jgi:hypothetical protein
MLHSDNIPDVSYRPNIGDLFSNFSLNWSTLSPVLYLLYGVLAGFFLLGLLIKLYRGE